MIPTLARKHQLQAQEKAKKLLKTLGITQDIRLTKYEMIIASNLVCLIIFNFI